MDTGKARNIAGLVVGMSERTSTLSSSAWWTMTCLRRTPAMGPRHGRPGMSAARLRSPTRQRHRPPAAWEVLPMGQRQLLQDLRPNLNTILCLSSCRQSRAHARCGTGGRRCAEDTAKGRHELERSLALHQQCLQQVLGLIRAETRAEWCWRRLKVVKLLPSIGQMSGMVEGGYEGEDEDEGEEVLSSIRRHLIFTTPQEERPLARAWWDLESQAEAILPKTVRAGALVLLRRLTDGGYISWRPDTLELTCPVTVPRWAPGAWLARPTTGLCRVRSQAQACLCQPWTGEEKTLLAPDLQWQGQQRWWWHGGGGCSHKVRAIRGWRLKKKKSYGKRKPLRACALIPSWWRRTIATGRRTTRRLPTVTSGIIARLLTGSRTIRSSLHHSHYCRNKNKNKKRPTTTTKPDLRQGSREPVRRVAWRESPSYGRPWAGGLLVGPSEKPWQQRIVTRCTGRFATASPDGRPLCLVPGEQLQCDLVDCSKYRGANDGTRYLFCFIDMFFRYAWAEPLTSKRGTEMGGPLQAILDMQDGPPLAVQSDKGTEMHAAPFQWLLKSSDKHFFTRENDDIKCAMLERFQRMLQGMIHHRMTANRTRHFVDVLPALLHTYNSTCHSAIGMAPHAVNSAIVEQVWEQLYLLQRPWRVAGLGSLPSPVRQGLQGSLVEGDLSRGSRVRHQSCDLRHGGWYCDAVSPHSISRILMESHHIMCTLRKPSSRCTRSRWPPPNSCT